MNETKAQIEALLYENAPDFEIAKVLKKEIKTYFGTLEETFATSGGKDFLVKHTKKIDSLLQIIYKVAMRSMFGDYTPMKNSIPVAMVALGSYGREQLCVYSDIDLMLVYKDIPGYNAKEMIEKILYILWDTGLKLGHRVHTTDELLAVSKTDITIKTALIESRFIEGSHFIWVDTQNAISQIRHTDVDEFIQLKLNEQSEKHHKFPLTMEPNLKEGVGGFRDANLVYWVGKILYNTDNIKSLPLDIINESAYKHFRIALEFLFRVRSALHLAAGKKEDQLRLDLIPRVAQLLHYEESYPGQMKLAKKVTASLKTIRLYSTIWLDELTREHLGSIPKIPCLMPPEEKITFHTLLQELCDQAKEPFHVHPTFLKALVQSKRPERLSKALYKTIASIFYQPASHSILHTLAYSRLLAYTIPPFKQIIDLPQFDGYHQYAVDTHSIRCIYHLEHIEDEMIQTLFDSLNDDEQALLKLVTFLHDAGKGRKRDHHGIGVSLFKVFAQKLGMDGKLMAMGETLIMYHTLMSRVAQREDLYSERVILSFVSHFKTQKLLDMIYILTYADMSGVGKDIYNSFNARLLRTLYKESLTFLDKTTIIDETEKRLKKEEMLQKNPEFKALNRSQQKKILQIPSTLFFLHNTTKRIMTIVQKAFEVENHLFSLNNKTYLTIEIIAKEDFNLGYLLYKLANFNVVNMDICQLFDSLTYYKIDFSQTADEYTIALIEEIMHSTFKLTDTAITSKPLIRRNEIKVDCDHSKTYATVQLHCKDQKGLLAYMITLFQKTQNDIVSAKTHTIKKHAVDLFLIEKNGNFCNNADMIIETITKGK